MVILRNLFPAFQCLGESLEKIARQFFGGGFDHSGAHCGHQSTDLDICGVVEFGSLAFFPQYDSRRSLHESRRALALHEQSELIGWLFIAQADFAGVSAFDSRNSNFQMREVFILGGFLELLAARDGLLQNNRIDQGLENLCRRAGELVRPLDDHGMFVVTVLVRC